MDNDTCDVGVYMHLVGVRKETYMNMIESHIKVPRSGVHRMASNEFGCEIGVSLTKSVKIDRLLYHCAVGQKWQYSFSLTRILPPCRPTHVNRVRNAEVCVEPSRVWQVFFLLA